MDAVKLVWVMEALERAEECMRITREAQYRRDMQKMEECVGKAREALKKGDIDMFKFWASASRAFEVRALDDNRQEREQRLFDQIKVAMDGRM